MILDTNAVSALFVGDSALGKVLGRDQRHHLPVIVIGEYRYGLLGSRLRVELEKLLANLSRESFVLPVDETTAETYAEVRDELRKNGRPIPENDIWIAALARQHHLPVVSRDDHFDYVPELRRVAW
ncbi:MAG: type II toxin-antitoxin system VapC family toxin [Thermoanaerobaculia bacterium]